MLCGSSYDWSRIFTSSIKGTFNFSIDSTAKRTFESCESFSYDWRVSIQDKNGPWTFTAKDIALWSHITLPESHFHFLLFLTWKTPQKKVIKCKINHKIMKQRYFSIRAYTKLSIVFLKIKWNQIGAYIRSIVSIAFLISKFFKVSRTTRLARNKLRKLKRCVIRGELQL